MERDSFDRVEDLLGPSYCRVAREVSRVDREDVYALSFSTCSSAGDFSFFLLEYLQARGSESRLVNRYGLLIDRFSAFLKSCLFLVSAPWLLRAAILV